MWVSLIFKCPDLFIPIMYTNSDMSIVVHVHVNVMQNKNTEGAKKVRPIRSSSYLTIIIAT